MNNKITPESVNVNEEGHTKCGWMEKEIQALQEDLDQTNKTIETLVEALEDMINNSGDSLCREPLRDKYRVLISEIKSK